MNTHSFPAPVRTFSLTLAVIAGLAGFGAKLFAEEWTSFTVDTLEGFSFTHSHLVDGRFVFGINGGLSVQEDFSQSVFTAVDNSDGRVFDPAFIAIGSATEGLIGGGGFAGPSGLYPFDPSAPANPVAAALATLQNYAAVYWRHPTSGREGWLITGGNGAAGGNNLSYVSADGAFVGPITGVLSAFSGGLATDASGGVSVALADFDPAIDNQLLVFTADQIDAAVVAVRSGTPAPLEKSAAANPFQANASGGIAVDALGRLWFGGYQIDHLQAWDPATGVTRRFFPDHAPLGNAAGPTNYTPRAFSHGGGDFVSFLANDAYYTAGSDLVLGYREVSELAVRSVQFTLEGGSAREDAGAIVVIVSITPAPTVPVTVPVAISGTATPGEDFTAPTEVIFGIGETEQSLVVNLLDDTNPREGAESVILTLGQPSPDAEAGLGVLGTESFTLEIEDNETPPVISLTQAFAPLKVGADFHHQVATAGGGDALRWSARGLPPGLRIDPLTGIISGTPTVAGEYDRLVITATNPHGRGVSGVFLLVVEPLPEAATGRFFALADRSSPETGGLGARIDLAINARGRWSGRVCVGARKYPMRGQIDSSGADPTLGASFRHEGNLVTLELTIDSVTGELSGGFTGGGAVSGWRAAVNDSRTDRCHFLLAVPGGPAPEVPEGTGFGVVRFGARDTVRVTGRAGDGTPFSGGGWLGADGETILYQPRHRPTGTLIGVLRIADDLPQTVGGDLTWSKPPQNRGTLYRDGWAAPLALQAVGGKFRPVDGATLPLGAAPGIDPNARLLLQDGGIDALVANSGVFPVTIHSAGRAVVEGPHRLVINHRTGVFRSVMTLATGAARRRVVALGLLIPEPATADPFDSTGHGFFLFPVDPTETRTGLVVLETVTP